MTDHVALSGVRVVHVDDDADHRLTVSELLAARGVHQLFSAGDAESGLALVAEVHPDLILLDLSMPGRSGLETLPEFTAAAPAAVVVVLSNLSRRQLLDEVLRRGAVGFVEKSADPARLVDEILVAATLAETAHIQLAADTTAAKQARRFTNEQLASVDRELAADVELVVSELVTNIVVHTTSIPRLRIHVSTTTIRLEAQDDDPTLPTRRQPSADLVGGRGLVLVDRLSTRWGADRRGGGKVVWAEFARDEPRPS